EGGVWVLGGGGLGPPARRAKGGARDPPIPCPSFRSPPIRCPTTSSPEPSRRQTGSRCVLRGGPRRGGAKGPSACFRDGRNSSRNISRPCAICVREVLQ